MAEKREKDRLIKICIIYHQTQMISCFLTIGLPALLPDFMKGPEYRARMAERRERDDYKSSDSSDSDEEWTPSMNRKKTKGSQIIIICNKAFACSCVTIISLYFQKPLKQFIIWRRCYSVDNMS